MAMSRLKILVSTSVPHHVRKQFRDTIEYVLVIFVSNRFLNNIRAVSTGEHFKYFFFVFCLLTFQSKISFVVDLR